jgi:acid phosphatase family membrane protein YuiD
MWEWTLRMVFSTHATFFNHLLRSQADVKQVHKGQTEFKELLGHQPFEVLVGGVLDIAISFVIHIF